MTKTKIHGIKINYKKNIEKFRLIRYEKIIKIKYLGLFMIRIYRFLYIEKASNMIKEIDMESRILKVFEW